MADDRPSAVDFDVIRKMVGEGDPGLLADLDLFLGGTIVVGAAVTMSPAPLALLEAKSEIVKTGARLIAWFTGRKAKNAGERFKHLAAAHQLLVYSAFFAAAHDLLAKFDRLFELQPDERERVVAGLPTPEGWIVAVPHPAAGLKAAENRVLEVHALLTEELVQILSRISGWDEHLAHIRSKLPGNGVEAYRAQYIDLAAQVPEFALWVSIRSHEATRATVDVGFVALREQVAALPAAIRGENAQRVLDGLAVAYARQVDAPILKPDGDRTYPSKRDIFVPQAYRVRRAAKNAALEDEQQWEQVAAQDDLPDFLLNYLGSPYSIETPLLILGMPGSGKSLLTQMLSVSLATPAFNPVRIELRNVDVTRDLQKLIVEQIYTDTGLTVEWPDLSNQMADTPPVIILDGFDELLQASGRAYLDLLEQAAIFQEREAGFGRPVRVIVTSRITLIDMALVPEGATVIRLLDFDEPRRRRWAEIWNSHHQKWFEQHAVEPFALPDRRALMELASQPLLLSMIALYDSDDNALRDQADLPRTALYDNLLRRFVEREREKAELSDFAALGAAEKQELIEHDMDRLRTVAIGMFNREAVVITDQELEHDISYLDVARELPEGSGRPLSQAELLLGSFFFVQQSDSGSGIGTAAGRVGGSAFEFLHATFGEFLAADFLLQTAMREARQVVAMRATPELSARCDRELREGAMPRAWNAALLYAPLYERPLILTMLLEWSQQVVGTDGVDPDAIADALDAIVDAQLALLVDGGAPMAFDASAPYAQGPLLDRYALYAINLILLRVHMVERPWPVALSRWRRLAGLWRVAIPFEETGALTSMLSTSRDGSDVLVRASDGGWTGATLPVVHNAALTLQDDVLAGVAGLHLMDLTLGERSEALATVEESLGRAGSLRRDLNLPILIRKARDARWRIDLESRRALLTHVRHIGWGGPGSGAERELAEMIASEDAPAAIVSATMDDILRGNREALFLPLADLEALLAVAGLDDGALRKVLSEAIESSAWLSPDVDHRVRAALLRAARPFPRLWEHAQRISIDLKTMEPDLLAAVAASPCAERAVDAIDELLTRDPVRAMAALTVAGWRDLVAALIRLDRRDAWHGWTEMDLPTREHVPRDVWFDLMRLAGGDELLRFEFDTTPASLSSGEDSRTVLAYLRYLAASSSQSTIEPITIPQDALARLPADGIATLLERGVDLLTDETYQRLLFLAQGIAGAAAAADAEAGGPPPRRPRNAA